MYVKTQLLMPLHLFMLRAKGFKGFGIQYGGECWSGPEIETRYNERGVETTCKDGKGSDWANDIYLI
jgi:hypothetical protein